MIKSVLKNELLMTAKTLGYNMDLKVNYQNVNIKINNY